MGGDRDALAEQPPLCGRGSELETIMWTLRGDALGGGIYEVRYSKDKLWRIND